MKLEVAMYSTRQAPPAQPTSTSMSRRAYRGPERSASSISTAWSYFQSFHCYFTAVNALVAYDGSEPFPSLEIEVRLTRDDTHGGALFALFEKIEVASYDV